MNGQLGTRTTLWSTRGAVECRERAKHHGRYSSGAPESPAAESACPKAPLEASSASAILPLHLVRYSRLESQSALATLTHGSSSSRSSLLISLNLAPLDALHLLDELELNLGSQDAVRTLLYVDRVRQRIQVEDDVRTGGELDVERELCKVVTRSAMDPSSSY